MKTIEEIKIELTLKLLSGGLSTCDIRYDLPKDDELRTFVCSLGCRYAYAYAVYVDKEYHEETKKAIMGHYDTVFAYARELGSQDDLRKFVVEFGKPWNSYEYATLVDKRPHDETRKGALKNPEVAFMYARFVDEHYREDTYEACCNTSWERTYRMKVKGTPNSLTDIRTLPILYCNTPPT